MDPPDVVTDINATYYQPYCNEFPDGLHKQTPENWRNVKHKEGKKLTDETIVAIVFGFLFLIFMIVFTVLYIKRNKPNAPNPVIMWSMLGLSIISFIIGLGTFISAATTVVNKPISVVYAASDLVARYQKFEPIMDVYSADYPAISAVKDLEANFDVLKAEVDLILAHKDQVKLTKNTYGGQNAYIGKDTYCQDGVEEGWRVFSVCVGDTYNESALKMCPVLCALMKKHSDIIMSCAISVLPPKSGIPTHIGYSSAVRRLMLPTHVPEDRENCFLCVNGNTVRWRQGQFLSFSDNVSHAVKNNTEETRVVIYMDVIAKSGHKLVDAFAKWVGRLMQNSSIVKDEIASTEILVKNKNENNK